MLSAQGAREGCVHVGCRERHERLAGAQRAALPAESSRLRCQVRVSHERPHERPDARLRDAERAAERRGVRAAAGHEALRVRLTPHCRPTLRVPLSERAARRGIPAGLHAEAHAAALPRPVARREERRARRRPLLERPAPRACRTSARRQLDEWSVGRRRLHLRSSSGVCAFVECYLLYMNK